MKKLYARSIAVFMTAIIFYSLFHLFSEKKKTAAVKTPVATTGADHPGEATAFEILKTKDPATGQVPRERLDAARQIQQQKFAEQKLTGRQTVVPGIAWTERGPDNVGGRTRAIMYDYNDPAGKKVWAGGVGGGLWYTTDITAATTVWTKINDTFNNLSISCITQGKFGTNKNKLFFGTGEGWGNPDAIRGNGIWRSMDGGATWTQLPFTKNSDSFRFVQDILYVENSGGPCGFGTPGVLAATTAGVFKSTNDGDSWTKVLGAGIGGGSINQAADLETAYYYTFATLGLKDAGGGGIYRSCDAGTTWEEIYDAPNTEQRIEIAPHYLDAWQVYAAVQGSSYGVTKIMKSSNADAVPASAVSFPAVSLPAFCNLSGATEFTRQQAWYDLIIEVAPIFRNPPANTHHFTAYVGGIDLHKTTSSGSGATPWSQVCEWATGCGKPYVHADKHNLVFKPDPVNAGYFPNEFLVATDGGIYRSTDGGATYVARNKSYNVTQFYSCAFHPADNNYFLAGSQDNNTQKFTTPGMNSTTNIVTQDSDGGFCFIDQEHPSIQIASYYNLQFAVSTNGGSNFANHLFSNTRGQFVNPIDYDNLNKVIYAGDNGGSYFRWTDPQNAGSTPVQVSVSTFNSAKVTFVKLSPNVTNRVYFGLDNGAVVRVDDAHTGNSKTGIVIRPDIGAGSRYLSCIAIDPGDENHMLITYSNYGIVSVYESSPGTGGSLNWNPIDVNSSSYSLPDMPIRWCMFDPRSNDWAILATEMGIWSTSNLNGTSTVWEPTNNGFANTRVDMLRYRNTDRLLLAATHGRGLFSTIIPAGAPLPLTLKNFEGYLIGNEIVLQWKTLFEQNTKQFDIERSTNGIHFKKIGFVNAASSSQNDRFYNFYDKEISKGKNFYRLKLIDKDESFEYSETILVTNPSKHSTGVTVLTNPFTDYIDVEFGTIESGKGILRLIDMSGRILFNKTYDVKMGNRLRVPVGSQPMAAGVYTFECILNNTRYVRSLLKK